MALITGDKTANYLVGGSSRDDILGLGGNDTLFGGDGDDLIYGGLGADRLFGGDDEDVLLGDAGADSLDGGAGNDVLLGGDGNDSLTGNGGDDIIFGGNGDDLLASSAGSDTIFGGAGNDTFDVGYFDRLDGGAGRDTLDGSNIGDMLNLTLEDDGSGSIEFGDTSGAYAAMSFTSMEVFIVGGFDFSGTFSNRGDTVYSNGAGGDFNLRGGRDTFIGGTGSDSIIIRPPDDAAGEVLNGGGGVFDTVVVFSTFGDALVDFTDDTLRNFENIRLQSLTSNHDLTVEMKASQFEQFVGNGRVYADNNDSNSIVTLKVLMQDRLAADFGDTAITNTAGDDFKLIFAGDRDDESIAGTEYADIIKGAAGHDTLRGKGGEDLILGGGGNDRLYGDYSDDTLKGGGGNDKLYGGALRDVLYGGSGNDLLVGGEGDNFLSGGNGNDILRGGAGSEDFYGGGGQDTMRGGGGGDSFIFRSVADSRAGAANRDIITDMSVADRIDLIEIDANATAAGNQAFTFINRAAFSGAGGELRWKKAGADIVVLIDTDGSKAGAEMEILLKNLSTIDAGDFIL